MGIFPYKPSIWGCPCFRKPPYPDIQCDMTLKQFQFRVKECEGIGISQEITLEWYSRPRFFLRQYQYVPGPFSPCERNTPLYVQSHHLRYRMESNVFFLNENSMFFFFCMLFQYECVVRMRIIIGFPTTNMQLWSIMHICHFQAHLYHIVG